MPSGMRFRIATILIGALTIVAACNKVPLLAPSNSSISVAAGTRVLQTGGSTEVTAFVAESTGTPVQNGTTVRFITSLGRVDPAEVETRNGMAVTTFFAGDASGIAEVRASSGGAGATSPGTTTPPSGSTPSTPSSPSTASNVVQIAIGAAAVDAISIRANPSSVSTNGGTVEVIAQVIGLNGRFLPGVPVQFSATAGNLNTTSAITDENGEARVRLTTNVNTNVTATAGGKSTTAPGAAIVAQPGPLVTLTCAVGTSTTNCASASLGEIVTFTASRGATTSVIRSAVLDFGDGTRVELGALTGPVTAAHRYAAPGNYTATLTAVDVNGETTAATQLVDVDAPIAAALTLTRSGTTVTARVEVSGGTVQRYDWNFGADANPSTTQTLTNETSATYTSAGLKTVTVTVRFADGRTTTSTASITIPPQ